MRTAIPLPAARTAGGRTLVYKGTGGLRTAVEDVVQALRSAGEDRAWRKAPIAMRTAR